MKTLKIATIATIVTIVIIVLCGVATAELYPQTAKVVEVDYDNNIVKVVTFNGFEYEFEGCEDYCIGDCVSLIMEDNETEKIFDDEIVLARYSGWELVNWNWED